MHRIMDSCKPGLSLIDDPYEDTLSVDLMPPLTPDSLESNLSSTQSPVRSFNLVIGQSKSPLASPNAHALPSSPLVSNVMTSNEKTHSPDNGVLARKSDDVRPEMPAPPKSRFFPLHAGHETPWNSIPNVLISNTAHTTGISPLSTADQVYDPLWNRFQDLRLLNREKHAFAEVCKVLIDQTSRATPEREQDLLARLEDRNWQLQRYRELERQFKNQKQQLANRIADLEARQVSLP